MPSPPGPPPQVKICVPNEICVSEIMYEKEIVKVLSGSQCGGGGGKLPLRNMSTKPLLEDFRML